MGYSKQKPDTINIQHSYMEQLKMRAGVVATLRVNPKDCMSVIDVLARAGVNTKDMSFPAMVSLALSAMMQGLREQQVIPDRSGFEYLDMMQPYLNGRNAKKLEITKSIHDAGSRLNISVPTEQREASPSTPVQVMTDAAAMTPEMKEVKLEFRDLNGKREAFEDQVKGISWTSADEDRWQQLYPMFFPGNVPPRIVD